MACKPSFDLYEKIVFWCLKIVNKYPIRNLHFTFYRSHFAQQNNVVERKCISKRRQAESRDQWNSNEWRGYADARKNPEQNFKKNIKLMLRQKQRSKAIELFTTSVINVITKASNKLLSLESAQRENKHHSLHQMFTIQRIPKILKFGQSYIRWYWDGLRGVGLTRGHLI